MVPKVCDGNRGTGLQAVHDRSEESWDVTRAQACGQLALGPSTFLFSGPLTGNNLSSS